jgi:hypothetical protein
MDIAGMWRHLHASPDEVPLPGAHLQTPPEPGITISATQQCQVVLPSGLIADEVTVAVTSLRPGVAAQVRIFTNFNNLGGSYQGPSTEVGRGNFTATRAQVDTAFVVLPGMDGGTVGWDAFLGIAADATWADGAPLSVALIYKELPQCEPGLFGTS